MQKLLLDTNILMLLLIGKCDRRFIRQHRRTAIYTNTDFDLLENHLKRYASIWTTPPVLTEASNLMGNDFHQTIARTIIDVCASFVEIYRPKEQLFASRCFSRLGYADASILLSLDDDTVVLTDDIKLYSEVLYEGRQSLNFNHIRQELSN